MGVIEIGLKLTGTRGVETLGRGMIVASFYCQGTSLFFGMLFQKNFVNLFVVLSSDPSYTNQLHYCSFSCLSTAQVHFKLETHLFQQSFLP